MMQHTYSNANCKNLSNAATTYDLMLYLVLQLLANFPTTELDAHLKLSKIKQSVGFPQGVGKF